MTRLEEEKIEYLSEIKRQRDEKISKYCGKHTDKVTVLADPDKGERFILLSLLGKGGYSEVYRAYDLDECKYVACKIHQFENNWSEQLKANYIKHAMRENDVHKDLVHRRVVR